MAFTDLTGENPCLERDDWMDLCKEMNGIGYKTDGEVLVLSSNPGITAVHVSFWIVPV